MTKLHRSYLTLLTRLGDEGGSAELDRYGRLVAGPPKAILQGDAAAWLVLVSHGLVAGEAGQLILTEAGRLRYHEIKAGMTRDAAPTPGNQIR